MCTVKCSSHHIIRERECKQFVFDSYIQNFSTIPVFYKKKKYIKEAGTMKCILGPLTDFNSRLYSKLVFFFNQCKCPRFILMDVLLMGCWSMNSTLCLSKQ